MAKTTTEMSEEVASRAAADPSVAELKVARRDTAPAADAEARLIPAVATVTEPERIRIKPDTPVQRDIGKGTLKVVSLTSPEKAETLAQSVTQAISASAPDLRQVTGNSVNMRNGPGTNYSVLARLSRGDKVEVLQDPGDGWVKLRVEGSGRIGWMADFLLAAAD